MLKFADGQTDRVITIGYPPSGRALITTGFLLHLDKKVGGSDIK